MLLVVFLFGRLSAILARHIHILYKIYVTQLNVILCDCGCGCVGGHERDECVFLVPSSLYENISNTLIFDEKGTVFSTLNDLSHNQKIGLLLFLINFCQFSSIQRKINQTIFYLV